MGHQISRGIDHIPSPGKGDHGLRRFEGVGERFFDKDIQTPLQARPGDGQIDERRRADHRRIGPDFGEHPLRIREEWRFQPGLLGIAGKLFVDIDKGAELGVRNHVHDGGMEDAQFSQTDERDADLLRMIHGDLSLVFLRLPSSAPRRHSPL